MKKESRKMGRVRKLTDKGYGFIVVEGVGSVFFHASQLVTANFKELKEGAILEFQIKELPSGIAATRILVVEDC